MTPSNSHSSTGACPTRYLPAAAFSCKSNGTWVNFPRRFFL